MRLMAKKGLTWRVAWRALKLWNDDQPPELLERARNWPEHGGYGLRPVRFAINGCSLMSGWQAKQEQVGPFFRTWAVWPRFGPRLHGH